VYDPALAVALPWALRQLAGVFPLAPAVMKHNQREPTPQQWQQGVQQI